MNAIIVVCTVVIHIILIIVVIIINREKLMLQIIRFLSIIYRFGIVKVLSRRSRLIFFIQILFLIISIPTLLLP